MIKVKIEKNVWDEIVNNHKAYVEENIKSWGDSYINKKADILSLCTKNFLTNKCEFSNNKLFNEIVGRLDPEIRAIGDKLVELYKTFSESLNKKWSASIFVDKTGIEVCPYCNINYTYVVKGKGGHVRGQIDHIVPKYNKYKKDEKRIKTLSRLLCMNIYNMIPCCSQCNQKKSFKIFKVYPYQFDNTNDYQAKYMIDINNSSLSIAEKREQIIKLKKNDFAIDLLDDAHREHPLWSNISEDLVLVERYNKHRDDLINLARLRLLYSESKVSDMKEYGVVFPFYDESNDIKKPLNKQYRDIIQGQFKK